MGSPSEMSDAMIHIGDSDEESMNEDQLGG